MKNVLVTGSKGQLGSAISNVSQAFPQFSCTYIDIDDLDLTANDRVKDYLGSRHFEYIINCAAFTAVDIAEKQPEKAFEVNAKVPAILSDLKGNARLIHISTDYVYNGSKNTPHTEEDIPQPVSVYAQSKLEGEKVLWNSPDSIVIRTSWLYSEFGKNFLKTMIRLSGERTELPVVYDQVGTPTYAGDLAGAIFHILEFSENDGFKAGIYNYSNEGVCSWFDFALEIMSLKGSACKITAVRTHEYPLPAVRPAYSVMDKSKIKRIFGIEIPYWRDSLKIAVKNLESNRSM